MSRANSPNAVAADVDENGGEANENGGDAVPDAVRVDRIFVACTGDPNDPAYTPKGFNAKKMEILNGSFIRTQFGLNVKLAAGVEESIDELIPRIILMERETEKLWENAKNVRARVQTAHEQYREAHAEFEEAVKTHVHAPLEVRKHANRRLKNWQNLLQVCKDLDASIDQNIAALFNDKELLAEKEKKLAQGRKLVEIFEEANLHVESLISIPLGTLNTDSIQMRVDLLNYYLDESLWLDGVILCQDNQDFIRELIWASSGFTGREDNNEQDEIMFFEELGEVYIVEEQGEEIDEMGED